MKIIKNRNMGSCFTKSKYTIKFHKTVWTQEQINKLDQTQHNINIVAHQCSIKISKDKQNHLISYVKDKHGYFFTTQNNQQT